MMPMRTGLAAENCVMTGAQNPRKKGWAVDFWPQKTISLRLLWSCHKRAQGDFCGDSKSVAEVVRLRPSTNKPKSYDFSYGRLSSSSVCQVRRNFVTMRS